MWLFVDFDRITIKVLRWKISVRHLKTPFSMKIHANNNYLKIQSCISFFTPSLKAQHIQCVNVKIVEIGGDCMDFNYIAQNFRCYLDLDLDWIDGWMFPPHLRCQQIPRIHYTDAVYFERTLFATTIFLFSLLTLTAMDNYSSGFCRVESRVAIISHRTLSNSLSCCHFVCKPQILAYDET